ncbi:hypothetical protein MBLNU459_g2838t1 [Dothideomycetes sp. NU459]
MLLPQTDTPNQEQASEDEVEDQNAAKGIINLLGVDVQRVSEFCGYNMDLLRGGLKITLAAFLLAALIGWSSTLAGFAVPVVLQPLNRLATKRYTSRQLEVMEARDNKAHVVTEALHGIRQIKISATEAQWEKRILEARERELQAQWNVYVWAIFLTFAWIAMPALIGAVALSVYAWSTWSGALAPYPRQLQKCLTLSVIHGTTGSGKSLLLAAIIGEADLISGKIQVPHAPPMAERNNQHATAENWIIPAAYAYVGQVPWIENASVKDTILYGLPYRHDRYTRVLNACALLEDIRMLPDGEDTEIGATGINLSGGQRWRLTFARALYSRAGILILDDIFSAVDSHVGRHLLDHGILGPLGYNRTKILVTHHIGLVRPYAAYLVKLNNDGTTNITDNSTREFTRTSAVETATPKRSEATASPIVTSEDHLVDNLAKEKAKKFIEDEKREQGQVKWMVYRTYLLASGGLRDWILAFVLFSLAAVSVVTRSYWLTLWTKTYTDESALQTDTVEHASPEASAQPHLVFYLSIYMLISIVSISLVALKIIFVIVAALRAARHLFEVITRNVLRAQLRWLDTQPVGRILNRFVGDFALIDSRLGGDMTWCANGFFSIVTIVAAALFVSMWMLIPISILSLLCIRIVYLYLDAARDVKRLEASAKSPMFELVGSTISGLATIRSFGRVDDYLARMYCCVDRYAQSSWYVLLATQWMRFRQGILGVLFTLCIAVGVAYFPGIDASLAGFALSFALDFSAVVEQTVSRYTSTELDMNSTERVLEYTHLGTESVAGADAAPSWPPEGKIVVRHLEVGYAKDLDPVLKDVNFSVQPCERVGIVGRTGSGKSSLTLALFRFLEARQGSIEIDGVDVASLKLHDVRNRLAIIPQDPVLFSGTLRSNLDPFDEHGDDALLKALERVTPHSDRDLADPRRSTVFTNLSFPIAQGGTNLSQGEKQLVCLARAIITRPKVMVLDEATSAVDMATDLSIQRSIREQFHHSTLLVVAHRLSTIADFDKILVMSDGRVAEYDEPKALAEKKGLFWKMLNESGEKEALEHLLG